MIPAVKTEMTLGKVVYKIKEMYDNEILDFYLYGLDACGNTASCGKLSRNKKKNFILSYNFGFNSEFRH